MQRRRTNKCSYNAGRNATCQDLIYQHMSSHYRRILNAKKVVDTSPPYCYKQRRPNTAKIVPSLETGKSCKERPLFLSKNGSPIQTDRSLSINSYKESNSCMIPFGSSRYHAKCLEDVSSSGNKKWVFDKTLVDRITFDTKNGPSVYCDDCTDAKVNYCQGTFRGSLKQNHAGLNDSRNSKRRLQMKGNESKQKRKYPNQDKPPPTDISVKHIHFFTSSNLDFKPRILKTKAVSKLRSMRVYYPPRRKKKGLQNKSSTEIALHCSPESSNCKCCNLCVCVDSNLKKNQTPKEQSQTSSRDSAYNGGVSSIADSRSPTPDQKGNKFCYCVPGEDRILFQKEEPKLEKPQEEEKSARDPESSVSSRNETPREPPKCNLSISSQTPNSKVKDDDELKQMKEDALYIKFIQDITVEILEKCLYTNKALKKIMRKHIMNNIGTLDKDRIFKEVENLRIQLGIPEDKNLYQLDLIEKESSIEIPQAYPIISDSEFTLPADDVVDKKLKSKSESIKSLSENYRPASRVVDKSTNNKNSKSFYNFNDPYLCKKVTEAIDLLNASFESDLSSKPTLTLFESGQNFSDKSETSFGSKRKPKKAKSHVEKDFQCSSSSSENEEKTSKTFTGQVSEKSLTDSKTKLQGNKDDLDPTSSGVKKLRCVSFWSKE